MLKVIVLGYGTFEKWLGHEGETPMDGITALINEAWGRSLALCAMWGHKERSATQQKALSLDQDGTLVLAFQLPEVWEMNFCC